MRSLLFGTVLLFAVISGNSVLGGFGPYGHGASNDIDVDWLYFGGEIIPGEMNRNLSFLQNDRNTSQNRSMLIFMISISGIAMLKKRRKRPKD